MGDVVNIFNLEAIVERWQQKYGQKTTAKTSGDIYYQIPIPRRYELLLILVLEIKALGKPKDFFTNSTRDRIVNEIIPRGKRMDRSTIDGFRGATRKSLNFVILEVYSSEDSSEFQKEYVQEEPKKSPKKIHDKTKYMHIDEPPVNDVIDEEAMKELLSIGDKKDE